MLDCWDVTHASAGLQCYEAYLCASGRPASRDATSAVLPPYCAAPAQRRCSSDFGAISARGPGMPRSRVCVRVHRIVRALSPKRKTRQRAVQCLAAVSTC